MITQPLLKPQQPSWQHALQNIITDPIVLLKMLEINPENIPWQWDKTFPLRVPLSFVARMQKGNVHDPLLRQILSCKEESIITKDFSEDPLQEASCNPIPGLLHKYHGRALVTFSSSCAVHCRYCFRRHFPYAENNPGKKGWAKALNYIASHSEIMEIILSGGDPLMAPNDHLAFFLEELKNIPHVKILRFHTRLPVVIPSRIDQGLLTLLKQCPLQVVMVYHINHPAEIIDEIAQGVMQLKQANVTVLNQSVLLKEINDDVEVLKNLSYHLFAAGILPYYLHLLDPVQGAHHFAISQEKAKVLQHELRSQLPGYLVPKFVREVPHEAYKIPLEHL
jgi:L-lysine 2,3-aminomutase